MCFSIYPYLVLHASKLPAGNLHYTCTCLRTYVCYLGDPGVKQLEPAGALHRGVCACAQGQGQQCRGRSRDRSRERGRGRKSKSGKEKRGKSGARAVVRERACKGGGGGERSRCRSRVGASRFASCADAQCVLASLRAQRLTSLSSDTGTMVCIGTPPIRVRRFSLRELC
jgi:hypothetical protein